MNNEDSQRVAAVINTIEGVGRYVRSAIDEIAAALTRPSTLYSPRLSIDGNQWCALYGDNLQDGVAGFGDSPAAAYDDFDVAWRKSLPATLPTGREP